MKKKVILFFIIFIAFFIIFTNSYVQAIFKSRGFQLERNKFDSQIEMDTNIRESSNPINYNYCNLNENCRVHQENVDCNFNRNYLDYNQSTDIKDNSECLNKYNCETSVICEEHSNYIENNEDCKTNNKCKRYNNNHHAKRRCNR